WMEDMNTITRGMSWVLLVTLLGVAITSLSWRGIVNSREINGRGDTSEKINNHRLGDHAEYANGRHKPRQYRSGSGTDSVGADKWVRWSATSDSTVYMQIDNGTPVFFAAGPGGTQGAPWMTEGHLYTFILQDANGNELARDQLDLRSKQSRNQ